MILKASRISVDLGDVGRGRKDPQVGMGDLATDGV